MYTRLVLLLSFLFCQVGPMQAQVTVDMPPKSFSAAVAPQLTLRAEQVRRLSPPDLERIRTRDRQNPGSRFAVPMPTDLDLGDGTWTKLDNGDRIWRLTLGAKDALGLAVFYDDFYLPPGSTLHMYDAAGKVVKGAYTYLSNPANGKFLTGFTPGEEAILEYYEPQAVRGQGRMHIFRVDYAYHQENYRASLRTSGLAMELGFGTSSDCHDNVNCSAGQDFAAAKRAVCRILIVVEDGTGFCTGSLMNNTQQDDRPLVLSAFHCQDGFTPLHDFWRFDFNYETGACANPGAEPGFASLLGCVQRAGRQANDFLLLELFSKIPPSYNAYFLGWNRASQLPQDATMIHHPRGDIKKIATSTAAITVFNRPIQWNNEVTTPANHHFTVNYDNGTYEIASSGAALLDQNQRVVGQLHGGSNSTCDGASTWFGRLHLAWEGGGTPATRLKDWLDPLDSGVTTLDGKENENPGNLRLEGMFLTDAGDPLPGVEVQLVGNNGDELLTQTDAQGMYRFEGLSAGAIYQINPFKPDNAANGLSVLDLILIRRHILNLGLLTSPFQILAADVNDSSSITTLDLVLVQKVILGLDAGFAALPPWTFLPADAQFVNNEDPFQGLAGGTFFIALTEQSPTTTIYDILAMKTGDVNNSADLTSN